jgi:signal transduction histidine kinase
MLTRFHHWLSRALVPRKYCPAKPTLGRGARLWEASRAGRVVLVLLTACLPFQPKANSQVREVRRVLVFYELGISSPAVALMDREMRAALDDSRYQIELYTEFMETALFDDPGEQQELRESYIHKYQNRKPDLIITLGPSPLQFMVNAHESFFAGIPIVFGGTSEQEVDSLKLDSHFAGFWEVFEPAKTLEVALRLQPGSRHVVVVGGVSSFDRHLEAIVRENLHGYEASLDFTYLTDLSVPNLLERLKHLPDHTIVLYTHIGTDAKGTRYSGASQAGPVVAGVANAPVFGPSDVDLGHGEVGGYLQSFAQEGKIVGGIAVRILNGERPQDVPVVRGANVYMFDWRALKRWGFRESSLPPGSTVLFRTPSLWERTKWAWVAWLLVILCVCILTLFVRLKRAKDQQLGLSGMLITAQERERSRLASEIHDDFSQRLAIFALELENAEEAISTSPDDAVRRVHNLLNSASELGADLHTLSHRLHSSTLERLGLVPGTTALCKEFAIQQGIEIDFLSEGVPRAVHPDVALCVFRIVQEALRNLKKHSRASKGQVRLRRVGDKLLISVSDEGIGFDVRDLSIREGLGIRSMIERAHLLDGRFEIFSKPGEGTRVEASVPLQPKAKPATRQA